MAPLSRRGDPACVRWYLRYPISYLHMSEMMRERGLEIDPSCIWRWVRAFTPFGSTMVRGRPPSVWAVIDLVCLLYKIIAARNQKRSTALATNVDFEKWGEYLSDGPLAMAFLDRLVEGTIILKVKGKSYRVDKAQALENQPD